MVLGRTRDIPAPALDTTTHPLLLDTTNNAPRLTSNPRRSARHAHRNVAIGPDLFQSLDEIMGRGSTHFFQQILAATGARAHAFQLDMSNMNADRRRHGQPIISAAIRVERGPRTPTPRQGCEFEPLITMQRWSEEAKILNRNFVTERTGRLANHVVLRLLPAAIEVREKAKIEAEEKTISEREERANQRAEIKGQDEEYTSTVAENAFITSDTTAELQAGQAVATSERPIEPTDDQAMDIVDDQDAPMIDAGVVETHEAATAREASAEALSSSQPSQRVTVMIHGSPVDITDTGIDPTFLEALPDDMREEVLNQHVRDQRAARVERPVDSQISTEFLDALPPELRAELIQQEAMDRSRQRAEESATTQHGQGLEMDPASFFASLDPTLRQTVLMEQDGGFLQSLSPHILAETSSFVDRQRQPHHRGTTHNPAAHAMTTRKLADHDAIQLLEKPGIAALVRLLFFPQVSKKTLLFKILVNLCENARTRADLFNILLGILQDGPADLAAVDRSFSQLTVHNTLRAPASKSAGKQKATSEYLIALPSASARIDAVPDLVVQRCLEGLTFIVSSNESASLFFLAEHELPVGLRRSTGKKGKGKEKQVPQTHYPIVLLLGLLDRQTLIRTPVIMESLVTLLATVTKPLTNLKTKEPGVSPSIVPQIAPPIAASVVESQADSNSRPG